MRALLALPALLLVAGNAVAQTLPAKTPAALPTAYTTPTVIYDAAGNIVPSFEGNSTTASGALEPPTAAACKDTKTSTALTANTSTTIAPANADQIAVRIQCGSGGVSVDETGAALAVAPVGQVKLFIPTAAGPFFNPPAATRPVITGYTAVAETCAVTGYLR
ncbi:hypothetical protein MEX01_49220 [Methylorubrum extorquens]|uniref:hypothetical protein n=1 Tax=Methylorubrum extorquens TaxID=408 RepID=UPI001168D0AA|nr:hypothetical protein [Methylorubrum extorquens]GEL44331.1 hypothetical protein MEX01_49220 [Methylorubrum extorquens]